MKKWDCGRLDQARRSASGQEEWRDVTASLARAAAATGCSALGRWTPRCFSGGSLDKGGWELLPWGVRDDKPPEALWTVAVYEMYTSL